MHNFFHKGSADSSSAICAEPVVAAGDALVGGQEVSVLGQALSGEWCPVHSQAKAALLYRSHAFLVSTLLFLNCIWDRSLTH